MKFSGVFNQIYREGLSYLQSNHRISLRVFQQNHTIKKDADHVYIVVSKIELNLITRTNYI